jgi:hypothetical protein
MSQDLAARAVNAAFMTEEQKENLRNRKKKSKTLRGIMNAIATQLKNEGVVMPDDIDPVSGAITYRLIKYATMDVDEMPQVYCPTCRRVRSVEAKAPCPLHPFHGDLPILIPEAKLAAVAVQAASKLMDKLYPNLSAVSATVNIEGKLELLVDKFVQAIVKFVPGDQRQQCMSELNQIVYAVREVEDAVIE